MPVGWPISSGSWSQGQCLHQHGFRRVDSCPPVMMILTGRFGISLYTSPPPINLREKGTNLYKTAAVEWPLMTHMSTAPHSLTPHSRRSPRTPHGPSTAQYYVRQAGPVVMGPSVSLSGRRNQVILLARLFNKVHHLLLTSPN